MRRLLLPLAFTVATACGYSWQAEVRRHAAVEHACPESRVQIIADNGNQLAREAQLAVCGDIRLYLHRNGGATYVWIDITADDGGNRGGVSP